MAEGGGVGLASLGGSGADPALLGSSRRHPIILAASDTPQQRAHGTCDRTATRELSLPLPPRGLALGTSRRGEAWVTPAIILVVTRTSVKASGAFAIDQDQVILVGR